MRVDVETAQMEKEALEQQLASRTHKGAPPTCILALRQEAAATHASIAGSLDLFAQVLEDVPGSFATATLQRQADAALASAFLLLKGEQARITTVMAELVRRAPDLEESFQAEQLLSADERSTALINARTIFTALQDEATTRAVAREAGATRGRGRPPKTEPKAIRKGKKG